MSFLVATRASEEHEALVDKYTPLQAAAGFGLGLFDVGSDAAALIVLAFELGQAMPPGDGWKRRHVTQGESIVNKLGDVGFFLAAFWAGKRVRAAFQARAERP